jgi:hypothetical protein
VLDGGYSKDEIERVIKNARWPEHISEDVLETINYKKND